MRDGCGAPCGVTCVPYSTVDVRSDVRCDAATHTAYVCVSPYAMFDILKNVCANEPYSLPFEMRSVCMLCSALGFRVVGVCLSTRMSVHELIPAGAVAVR